MSVTTSDPSSQSVKSPSASQLAFRRLRRHKAAMISLGFIVFVIFVAIFAPFISPYDPTEQDIMNAYAPPNAKHWLGTDDLGRDFLSRIIYGSRVSLVVGIAVALMSVSLGTLVGMTAGFIGGKTDLIISRFTEIMMSLPIIPLQLVISGLLATSDNPLIMSARDNLGVSATIFIIITVFVLFGWMGTSRLVRGEVLRLKNLEYVDAARALGANNIRVMLRHLLPNIMGVLIVAATVDVGSAILGESALSFLGFGIQPPVSTWGNMLSSAQEVVITYPWIPFYPGLCILFTVLSFNFLGDGLRDAFDPRGRR